MNEEEMIYIDDKGNIIRKRNINLLGGIIAAFVAVAVGAIIVEQINRNGLYKRRREIYKMRELKEGGKN
jgi:hypothetical protein